MPIREPVDQITLRVPSSARTTLDQMCLRCGATRRALFEAIITVAFEDGHDPTWAAEIDRLWGAAKALEDSGALQGRPRVKIIIHLDPELAADFRQECRRRGVSLSAALAFGIMPSPHKEGEGYVRYKEHVTPRLVALARRLDHKRRSRGRG